MSKMAFELDDAAEAEFYEIVNYYKQFDEKLSYDFIQEFEDVVQKLIKFPIAGHLSTSVKAYFPYAIVYKVYGNVLIMVFAIMHMKRKPDYWEKRIK